MEKVLYGVGGEIILNTEARTLSIARLYEPVRTFRFAEVSGGRLVLPLGDLPGYLQLFLPEPLPSLTRHEAAADPDTITFAHDQVGDFELLARVLRASTEELVEPSPETTPVPVPAPEPALAPSATLPPPTLSRHPARVAKLACLAAIPVWTAVELLALARAVGGAGIPRPLLALGLNLGSGLALLVTVGALAALAWWADARRHELLAAGVGHWSSGVGLPYVRATRWNALQDLLAGDHERVTTALRTSHRDWAQLSAPRTTWWSRLAAAFFLTGLVELLPPIRTLDVALASISITIAVPLFLTGYLLVSRCQRS